MEVRVVADLKKLNKVVAALVRVNQLAVKVGILSAKNSRSGAGSNASIGAVHEFGSYSKNIPQRSFIKMPLQKKSGELIKQIQEIGAELVAGDITPVLKKIGAAAEAVIGEAFASGGFGTWDPIAPTTEKRKGSDAILIETSQLQRSITSAVVKKGT